MTKDQFRYPGPVPQSRETALVMLADSVEAAAKARNKAFESLRELTLLVDEVIQTKLQDGQLDNVDFTLRDMTIIKSCFVEILRSTYHSREVRDIKEIVAEQQNSLKKSSLPEAAK